MEYTPEEIIDKMSIIKLKLEKKDYPILKEEYLEYEEALEEFRKRGIKIDPSLIEKMYNLNKKQWIVMEKINVEKQKIENLEEIGRLFIKAEELNKARNAVKNKIVEETGKGFKEIKMN